MLYKVRPEPIVKEWSQTTLLVGVKTRTHLFSVFYSGRLQLHL